MLEAKVVLAVFDASLSICKAVNISKSKHLKKFKNVGLQLLGSTASISTAEDELIVPSSRPGAIATSMPPSATSTCLASDGDVMVSVLDFKLGRSSLEVRLVLTR